MYGSALKTVVPGADLQVLAGEMDLQASMSGACLGFICNIAASDPLFACVLSVLCHFRSGQGPAG